MSKTPYQYINLVGKNLQSGINQLKKTNVGYINVKQAGAVGDGITDDSAKFDSAAKGYIVNDGVYKVSNDVLTALKSTNCIGTGKLKATAYVDSVYTETNGLNTGEIPISRLSDPIFLSMKMQSDNPGVMNRNYPQFHRTVTAHSDINKVRSIAAIYPIGNSQSNTLIFSIGKMKLFGYSKSEGVWKLLKENYINNQNVALYEVKNGVWSGKSNKNFTCTTDRTTGITRIEVTKENLAIGCLHFWGATYTAEDSADIEYVINMFEASVVSDDEDKCIIANACDYVNNAGTVYQAFHSRNYFIKKKMVNAIGHNIPDSVYETIIDLDKINFLFQKPIDASGKKSVVWTVPATESNYANAIPLLRFPDEYTKVVKLTATYDNSFGDMYQTIVLFYTAGASIVYPKTLQSVSTWQDKSKLEGMFNVIKNDTDGYYYLYANKPSGSPICVEAEYLNDEDTAKKLEILSRCLVNFGTNGDIWNMHAQLDNTDLTNATIIKNF